MVEINLCCRQASVAKLETSVSFVSDKLDLKIYGFNDKLPVLLSKVLTIAKSFMPTDDRFKVIILLFFIFYAVTISISTLVLCAVCLIISVGFLACIFPSSA